MVKKRKKVFCTDSHPCEAVNVISDITNALPFLDGSVEDVWMDNVIEHVLDIPLVNELNSLGSQERC